MSERSTRRVDDDEYVDMDTLVEKFHQGAIWHGMTELNIGWPEELHISGPNVIRLLMHLREEAHGALEDVRQALDSHKVPNPQGLSQADRIHLLVGRKTR
jgi:hypothetical protein